jgi:hypothetical protein
MNRLRWTVLAILALSLLAGPAAIAAPVITDPANPQQRFYPIIISQDVGPGEVAQAFTGCEVNEQTGQRDTLVRYTIRTTGTVEIVSSASGPGFIFTRATGGAEGGMVLHVLLCERTATAAT